VTEYGRDGYRNVTVEYDHLQTVLCLVTHDVSCSRIPPVLARLEPPHDPTDTEETTNSPRIKPALGKLV
jgi:hypothetical protein